MEEVAALVESPEEILEIQAVGDPFSMEGIQQFPNLERLAVDGEEILEIRELVQAQSLKSLSLDLYEGSADFTVFGVMPWLEALRSRPELERLTIESCDELKDMSAVASLTGLKELKLEVPYDCPEPDLSALTGMESLYLESFSQTGFLNQMPALVSLTLDGCQVSGGGGIVYVDWDDVNLVEHMDFLGNLGGLKKLSVQGNDLTDLSFASSLAALEEIDLSDNYVTDLTPLSGLKALKTVICTENPISNYEVLKSSVTVLGDY